MKAYCLNNISKVALATLAGNNTTVDTVEAADSILVRSYQMADYELPQDVVAVARAGAGVNNIPLDKYADKGVVVFNTPGANANAVKELVLCGLFMASRDLIGGVKYINENKENADIAKAAEKAKACYAGCEIKGKTIGVIGLGVIGVLVANACNDLGMNVIGYDPYLSIQNAMSLAKNVKYVEKLEDLIEASDYVTIHVPLNPATKEMVNKDVFDKMKDGTIVLNFSRDALVNDDDLKEAIENGKVKKYVTDFANPKVVNFDNVICFPHLGASTEEAEDNCALMAINQLIDYIDNGNIKNSVNYPQTNAGVKKGAKRICICHLNKPGMIAKFTAAISEQNGNIETLVNNSKGNYAYTIIDVDNDVCVKNLKAVEDVLRIRVI